MVLCKNLRTSITVYRGSMDSAAPSSPWHREASGIQTNSVRQWLAVDWFGYHFHTTYRKRVNLSWFVSFISARLTESPHVFAKAITEGIRKLYISDDVWSGWKLTRNYFLGAEQNSAQWDQSKYSFCLSYLSFWCAQHEKVLCSPMKVTLVSPWSLIICMLL